MGTLAAILSQLLYGLLVALNRLSAALSPSRKHLHHARFAQLHELASLQAGNAPGNPETSLLLGVGELGRVLRVRPTRARRELGNLLVVAPTRGGKGLLATSQLLTWQGSVVVNDIKGELFAQTGGSGDGAGRGGERDRAAQMHKRISCATRGDESADYPALGGSVRRSVRTLRSQSRLGDCYRRSSRRRMYPGKAFDTIASSSWPGRSFFPRTSEFKAMIASVRTTEKALGRVSYLAVGKRKAIVEYSAAHCSSSGTSTPVSNLPKKMSARFAPALDCTRAIWSRCSGSVLRVIWSAAHR